MQWCTITEKQSRSSCIKVIQFEKTDEAQAVSNISELIVAPPKPKSYTKKGRRNTKANDNVNDGNQGNRKACEKVGHTEPECYTKKRVCTSCDKVGHMETQCYAKKRGEVCTLKKKIGSHGARVSRQDETEKVCTDCGKLGHTDKLCFSDRCAAHPNADWL